MQVNKYIGNKVKIMGVVKADGYGHGSINISKVLIESGVDYLAVATLGEALEIREKYNIPILVLGYIESELISTAIENYITLTIFNSDFANKVNNEALKLNKKSLVHIKFDTGMTRLGFMCSQINEVFEISKMSNLKIEGVFTHFSSADSDEEYTYSQYQKFVNICNRLEENFCIKYKHCCNSAATIRFPMMHMDMVRVGILLYGLRPFEESFDRKLNLIPAMSVKSKIIDIKKIESNTKISYSGKYVTKENAVIAVIPIGYADGLSRGLSNNFRVLVDGNFAPIRGTICMDQCIIDITQIKNANIGDQVVIMGRQFNNAISVNEIADRLNTINYEVICSFSKRVPRIYI